MLRHVETLNLGLDRVFVRLRHAGGESAFWRLPFDARESRPHATGQGRLTAASAARISPTAWSRSNR